MKGLYRQAFVRLKGANIKKSSKSVDKSALRICEIMLKASMGVSKTDVFQAFQRWSFHTHYSHSDQLLPDSNSLKLKASTVVKQESLKSFRRS